MRAAARSFGTLPSRSALHKVPPVGCPLQSRSLSGLRNSWEEPPRTLPAIVGGSAGKSNTPPKPAPLACSTQATQRQPVPPHRNNHTAHSRPFSSSATSKSQRDSSTMDFAYFPLEYDLTKTTQPPIAERVPLLPQNFDPPRTGPHAPPEEDFDTVHRAEIHTLSGEGTHFSVPSPMQEVHDNPTMNLHGAAEALESATEAVSKKVSDEVQALNQLWNGMLEDMLGRRESK